MKKWYDSDLWQLLIYILAMLLVAFMVVLGGVPTIYILVSLPVILVQKIYGIVKNGKSFFD